MKTGIIAGLCAAFFSVAAQAGVYSTTFTTSHTDTTGNYIAPGGYFTLGSQQDLTGQTLGPIMSIELTLVFNDPGALLSPPNDGMEGQLILGTAENSPYVKFTPVETSTSAGNVIYDVTFSNFNGLSPNNIWGLDLWDNNATHQGNTLISWSLTVEVPEPVDVALVVFGLMFTAILVTRRCRAKKLPAPAHPQHSI